jgi:hypothetical protein
MACLVASQAQAISLWKSRLSKLSDMERRQMYPNARIADHSFCHAGSR